MTRRDSATAAIRSGSRAVLHSAFCILNYGVLVSCSSPTPIQVSYSGRGAYEAALATDETGFAVAWHDMRDGNAEIYLRRLDAEGRPVGAEQRLTDTPGASYEASIERLGRQFVIAWYEQAKNGEQTAMLGAWDRAGGQRWMKSLTPSSRNPVIRANGEGVFGAWIQAEADGGEAVWAGWWDADGHARREPVRLGPASKTTWNLNAATDRSGTGWVVFDAAISTRANELFLARVGASGTHIQRLTRDDGKPSKYPDLAIDEEGHAAIAWYDERDGNEEVYLLVGTSADLSAELDGRAHRITTTPGESLGAYLAWNAGRLGLAWSDKDDTQHDVFFQSFDAEGRALQSARRVTRSPTWSLVPSIKPWQSGFALAWNEYLPASAEIHDGTSEVSFVLVR